MWLINFDRSKIIKEDKNKIICGFFGKGKAKEVINTEEIPSYFEFCNLYSVHEGGYKL